MFRFFLFHGKKKWKIKINPKWYLHLIYTFQKRYHVIHIVKIDHLLAELRTRVECQNVSLRYFVFRLLLLYLPSYLTDTLCRIRYTSWWVMNKFISVMILLYISMGTTNSTFHISMFLRWAAHVQKQMSRVKLTFNNKWITRDRFECHLEFDFKSFTSIV